MRIDSTLATARENRGEALLALNRVDEAKQTYVDLFPTKKALASLLLHQMQHWIAEQRYAAQPAEDTGSLDAFQEWVQERSHIAGEDAATSNDAMLASTSGPGVDATSAAASR